MGIDWYDESDDELAVDMDDFADQLFNAAPEEVNWESLGCFVS